MQFSHIAIETSQTPPGCQTVPRGPVLDLPLGLVVELDRERDERLREQRRQRTLSR